MDYMDKIIGEIEVHSVEGIKECFEHGVSPNATYKDSALIFELTSEYARTSRFKECVKVFIEYGLEFEDKALLAVLTDEATALDALLASNQNILLNRYTLKCAYSPFYQVSLLHICAEYNHLSCAEILVKHGADINVRAGLDEFGFGGQTPIFHTVNQNSNHSKEVLNYLLSSGADLEITLKGLIWGKGYTWETFIPAINPISYAMMGLLPQMHRSETVISKTVSQLIKAAYDIDYTSVNVPCAYLK